jgi:small subunit ribosomal protein S9
VYLRPGEGKIIVNKRTLEQYFSVKSRVLSVMRPFEVTETSGKFDAVINAKGGGLTGQAEAIRLGISRALVQFDEDLKGTLRQNGLLTRDPRIVERKKYGQPKARKRFQFSKR